MLPTLFLIVTAHAAAQCELPPTSPAAADELRSPLDRRGDRPGLLDRLRGRTADRQARRDRSGIDHTLRKFFRSLRHRRAERRAHRGAGPLARLRDRRGAPTNDDPAPGAHGAVTVPHEDPVDLPLYPQPNQ